MGYRWLLHREPFLMENHPISSPVYYIVREANVVGCVIGWIDYSELIYCNEVPATKVRNVHTEYAKDGTPILAERV
jgi:hypothetical protein